MKWKRTERRETESRGTCDLCGGRLNGHNDDEIELLATLGRVWPEGDCRRVEEFDCCSKCWADKVRPAIEALGGKVHRYQADEGRTHTMPYDPECPVDHCAICKKHVRPDAPYVEFVVPGWRGPEPFYVHAACARTDALERHVNLPPGWPKEPT
jgi:hypothetical protein